MSPEPVVLAVTELPPAVTSLKSNVPPAADKVIAPLVVLAAVTVSPPAVSATLIVPVVPDTLPEVAAVLSAICEPAVIDTAPPDTSAARRLRDFDRARSNRQSYGCFRRFD